MFVLGGLALSVWRSCLSSWSPERWRGISELIPPTLQCFSQKWNPATFFHIAKHYQDRNQHMKEHTCADGSFIAICLAMALFVTVVQLCMICVGLHSSFFMKKMQFEWKELSSYIPVYSQGHARKVSIFFPRICWDFESPETILISFDSFLPALSVLLACSCVFLFNDFDPWSGCVVPHWEAGIDWQLHREGGAVDLLEDILP